MSPNGYPSDDVLREEKRQADYRNSLVTRTVRELDILTRCRDIEIAHSAADKLLCDALVAMGCKPIVDAWTRVPKWYA